MCPNGRYLRDSEDRVKACLSFFYQLDRSTLARPKSNAVFAVGKTVRGSVSVALRPRVERDLHSEM